MFAYCNNCPVSCFDSEGNEPVRNKALMTCDSGYYDEQPLLNYLILKNSPDDVKYYSEPAITGTVSTNNINGSVAVSASLSHGKLGNDSFSMTSDFLCAEVGMDVGPKGLTFQKGFYLAKLSFSVETKWGFSIEFGGSIGWGNKTEANANRVEFSNANVLGYTFAIVYADKSETYYLSEIKDLIRN